MGDVKLTAKQKELLEEITQELRRETALSFIDGGYENQTKAYLDACKKMGKKPSKNPTASASEILSYPNVLAFINSVKAVAAERTQTNAEYVLRRLRDIDELDIVDILKPDMSGFRPINEWPKSWRISINAIEVRRIYKMDASGDPIEEIVEKVKWPCKLRNLELIGKHVDVGAFNGDRNIDDSPIGKIQIEVVGANGNN